MKTDGIDLIAGEIERANVETDTTLPTMKMIS